jgi:hypothetical protein
MNRLPPNDWKNIPSYEPSSIIYDNKEQNNDRLLDRHFLFSEIERTTPLAPNNFISSSRRKGLTAYNETLQNSESIYGSSLYNSSYTTSNNSILNRSLDINRGRGAPGWIDFSNGINVLKKEDTSAFYENRRENHLFDTLGFKHKNQGERPIAQPSNPWAPSP